MVILFVPRYTVFYLTIYYVCAISLVFTNHHLYIVYACLYLQKKVYKHIIYYTPRKMASRLQAAAYDIYAWCSSDVYNILYIIQTIVFNVYVITLSSSLLHQRGLQIYIYIYRFQMFGLRLIFLVRSSCSVAGIYFSTQSFPPP